MKRPLLVQKSLLVLTLVVLGACDTTVKKEETTVKSEDGTKKTETTVTH